MKKVIIVGAGMAGLTAAAYLARAGYSVVLIEKNNEVGGLVKSFKRDGFVFDFGAKSIENSGVIKPMLKDLGISLELLKSPVSIGIEGEIISPEKVEDVKDYQRLLEKLYPKSVNDIEKIISFVKKILKDMSVLYGLDNPYFKNLTDKAYLIKELLPFAIRFFFTINRLNKLQEPVEDYLKRVTSNESLRDIISQHFFKNTPVFFALGYYYVYLDYLYPRGGTGELARAMEKKIKELGVKIITNTKIVKVKPKDKKLFDSKGKEYSYDELIWCADLKALYNIVEAVDNKIVEQKSRVLAARGGDSVFNLMIGLDEPASTYAKLHKGHFFFTPSKKGLGDCNKRLKVLLKNLKKRDVLAWLDDYCRLNTYEISVPAMRDKSLAPKGKTGLIVSFLLEYDLVKAVRDAGWLSEFIKEVEKRVIRTLNESVYPGISEKIICSYSFNPLSISEMAGTSEGGIAGWSYEKEVPVETNLRKMALSVKTPIPNVLQAGQWAYSPAGIPTAIITGWLAAQDIIKRK